MSRASRFLGYSLDSTGLCSRYLDPEHQDRDQLASNGLDEGDEVAREEGSGEDDQKHQGGFRLGLRVQPVSMSSSSSNESIADPL